MIKRGYGAGGIARCPEMTVGGPDTPQTSRCVAACAPAHPMGSQYSGRLHVTANQLCFPLQNSLGHANFEAENGIDFMLRARCRARCRDRHKQSERHTYAKQALERCIARGGSDAKSTAKMTRDEAGAVRGGMSLTPSGKRYLRKLRKPSRAFVSLGALGFTK